MSWSPRQWCGVGKVPKGRPPSSDRVRLLGHHFTRGSHCSLLSDWIFLNGSDENILEKA